MIGEFVVHAARSFVDRGANQILQHFLILGSKYIGFNADFLRDGIYELRISLRGVHHRILYFFQGTVAAVVSHGLVKERVVPPKEIDRAIERKKRFEANPPRHTYEDA